MSLNISTLNVHLEGHLFILTAHAQALAGENYNQIRS